MKKKTRAILHLIIVGIILFSFITIYFFNFFIERSKSYNNKILMLGNTEVNYPYFADEKDLYILETVNQLASKKVDHIKYVVNFIGNYVNILFKLYADDLIIDYRSIIFDRYNKVVNSSEIITNQELLTEKMDLYLQVNELPISNDELMRSQRSYLFKAFSVEIYLTNYNEKGHITLIDLDYHELENCLRFSHKLSKNYQYLSVPKEKIKTIIPIINEESKLIAFTFDDGPSKYTLDILDTLDSFGAKATFFMVGYNVKLRNSLVLEVIGRGHEVGNHTIDHARLTKLKEKQILAKINSNNELFSNITNREMLLLRPPYGAINNKIKSIIEQPIIMWSLDSRDWENRNAKKIVELVLKDIKAGDIVLFHDLYESTVEAIKILLPILYADNYCLVTVSELFANKNIDLEKGNIYKQA